MIYLKQFQLKAKKGQKIRNRNSRIRDSKTGRNQSVSVSCRITVSERRSTDLLVRQSISVGCRFKKKKPRFNKEGKKEHVDYRREMSSRDLRIMGEGEKKVRR